MDVKAPCFSKAIAGCVQLQCRIVVGVIAEMDGIESEIVKQIKRMILTCK